MTLQELREEKGRLATQANEILEAAEKEGRHDLRSDEDKRFEDIHTDIEKISKQIARLEKQQATMASLEEVRDDKRPTHNVADGGPRRETHTAFGKITDHDRVEAFRAWALAGTADVQLTDDQRSNARRCGINVDSKRLVMQFGPPMRATHLSAAGLVAGPEDIRSWQDTLDEARAALTGAQSTTTTGGYTTADETMRALEVALLAFGGMRTVSTVIRTATGGPLPIPTTNDTANKGEIIGENTTQNELEMTFGQLVLDAYKYTSKYILASVEFLQDSSINVSQFIGGALADRIGRITNDHFTTGTGSQPNGVVTAATTSGITTAAAATVTYDNMVDLIHSVDPEYRNGARFMMHDSGLKLLKKLKVLQYSGDTVGVPLWVPGLTSGVPDTILGYPYTINQSVVAPAAGTKSFLFGDFSKYIIRDVRDFTLMRLDELYAVLGQVAFLAFSRHDGDLLDAGTHPIKYLTQGA